MPAVASWENQVRRTGCDGVSVRTLIVVSHTKRHSAPLRRTLTILAIVSLATLLTPQVWLHKMISLAQVLVPFQHMAQAGADAVGHALTSDGPDVTRARYDALSRSKQAADHQVAALSVRVEALEREVSLLTATRLWDVGGGGLGADGQLIPARVLVSDIVPWRSSRLLTAGTVQGVRRGAPVVSSFFTIDRGADGGVQTGRAILLGETLIGVVARVGTHTSRVQLLSDPATQMKVRIGRYTEDGFAVVDGYFWLVGRGGGVMEIRDVERQDVEAGLIQVGDQILSDPTSTALPAALVVGAVSQITSDRHKPLFATLTIDPAIEVGALQRVYVFAPVDQRTTQEE